MYYISSYIRYLSEKIATSESITFLGTGPARPILEKRGKSRRLNSSIIIKYSGKSYLIDVGPTFDKKTNFDFLFLTHLHTDAFGGFKYVKDREFILAVPNKLSKDIKFKNKESITVDKKNSVGDLKVIPFPVIHDVIYHYPTYGYQFIFKDDKKLTYASDMVKVPKRSEKYFNNIDILITDGAGWKSNLGTHFGVMPFMDIVEEKEWKIGKIYFTQIGRPLPNHEKAQKELSERNPEAFELMMV